MFLVILIAHGCKSDINSGQSSPTKKVAVDDLTKHLTNTKSDAVLYFDRAVSYYEQASYDQAISDLKKAIEIDSLVAPFYHVLSDCYMDYYRSRDALLTMQKASELFPERTPTLLKLSEIQLILKQYDESLMTVAQIMMKEPDNPEAHFMKGMNFRSLGETDKAINAFQKATEINPGMTDAWVIAGELLEQKGVPLALDYFKTATEVDPKNPTTWHSLAYYLQNNGKERAALEMYRKINVLDKNYTDAYLNSGILYMTMDSLALAKEQFDIMSKVSPQNHLPYYYKGLILESQGQISAARTELENCLNLNPEFTRAQKAINNLAAS